MSGEPNLKNAEKLTLKESARHQLNEADEGDETNGTDEAHEADELGRAIRKIPTRNHSQRNFPGFRL